MDLSASTHVRDLVNPSFHQNNFAIEGFLKTELGLKLDKGMSSLC